ncbi:MAG: trypsin-like serine protease [Lachnospiraceae bacterium]|nr:trypsin-like serine protease [Lachnospiraceae bacterium]
MPCVVSINNRYVEKMSFWGQVYSSEARSAGSGFIVGKNETELLLVSNQHVVASAEELTVQFVDGTQAQAQIKGVDVDKDLAVIAVQLEDIEADTMSKISIAKLGDSDSLTVGEPAIAIGNALGYGQSVTTGVVSALDRAIASTDNMETASTGDTEINTFIQTDAAINPGNSGGALLNMKGEVIGINSNKIGGSAVEGMGYAIPISDVKPIIENLMSKQTRLKVDEDKRGYLGITGVDVKDDYSELFDLPKGVYVSSVVEGAAADQAGIMRGYVITAINGEEIESMLELKEELTYYAAGDTVELSIMKMMSQGYETDTVSVTLGKQSTIQ